MARVRHIGTAARARRVPSVTLGRYERAVRETLAEVSRVDWTGFSLILFGPVVVWLLYCLLARP